MDVPVVLASFALGVAATGSCLGICLPFFLPFVVQHDNSSKKGLMTSMVFSAGRLVVYMGLGLVFYFILSDVLRDMESLTDVGGLRVIPFALGIIIIIYAVWLFFKLPAPKVCPAKYARGIVSLILGMLIGSFICPPFIFMMVNALDETVIIFIASVTAFWVGSSISIVYLGILAGRFSQYISRKKNQDMVRNICAMILVLTGIWFIISAFISY